MEKGAKQDPVPKGLDEVTAEELLEKFGENRFFVMKRPSVFSIFMSQFQLPIIILLFGIVFLITVDFAVGMLALILVLATVSIETIRDMKVRNAIKGMQERHQGYAIVFRGGIKQKIEIENVVPGDIVFLSAGMRVPGDGTVVSAKDCYVDEEIFGRGILKKRPVTKREEKEVIAFEKLRKEEKDPSQLLAGTFVVKGECLMKVTGTGASTKVSKIYEILRFGKEYAMMGKVKATTEKLSPYIMGIAILIFVVLLIQKFSILGAFVIAAAAAIAGIPQSMLQTARVSFFFALDRIRGLAIRRNDIADRLEGITVVCSEKIGALSKGEPTVGKIIMNANEINVTGNGWTNRGSFVNVKDWKSLELLTRLAVISTEAVPYFDKKEKMTVYGDPMEGALMVMGMKNLQPIEALRTENYTIERKYDPTTGIRITKHRTKEGKLSCIHGRANEVIKMCNKLMVGGKEVKITKKKKEEIHRNIIKIAADGFDVYALGYYKEIVEREGVKKKRRKKKLKKLKFILLALMGIYDPIKPQIMEMVNSCKRANIRFVVLTREEGSSAIGFARQIGILEKGTRAVIADQLRFMREPEKSKVIKRTVIFAEADPGDKRMVIEELKKTGEKVLFIEAGKADVGAIEAANATISLESATDLSKFKSDAILLKDDFYWVPKAIEESRALSDHIKRSFYALFISNLAITVFILLSSIFIGKTIGLLQILLVNIIADSVIGIGLATERIPISLLKAPKKPITKKKKALLEKEEVFPTKREFYFSTFFAVLSAILLLLIALYLPKSILPSIASAGLIIFAVFNTFSFTAMKESIFMSPPSSRIILAAIIAIAIIGIFIYLPSTQQIFDFQSLTPMHWAILAGAGIILLLIAEIKKAVVRILG